MITRPLFISTFCCIDPLYDKAPGISASHISNVRILSDDTYLTSGTGTIDFSGLAQQPLNNQHVLWRCGNPLRPTRSSDVSHPL